MPILAPHACGPRSLIGSNVSWPTLKCWRRSILAIVACGCLAGVAGANPYALVLETPGIVIGDIGNFVLNDALNLNPASPAKFNTAFSLPAQPNDLKDALDEFQRLVKHEAWEKAFKSLETITGKTAAGFTDRNDGVLVPSRLLVRRLLATLPSAGRNAYRVFYNSQATALWDKAQGKAELENLARIVDNHLISSVGDRAADRLGDLYFEQGEMEQAIAAWQSAVLYCPDSQTPRVQLLAKIATALARAERWDDFRALQRQVLERYAAESVAAAGRQVGIGEYLAGLVPGEPASQPAVLEAKLPPDFTLPPSTEPLWQFNYQMKIDPATTANPFQLMDIYGRPRSGDFLVPAAVDDVRVYVNLLGIDMAFDLHTGKLLWRSGKLQQLQNLQQQGRQVQPDRYGLMVQGGRTWSLGKDPAQINQGQGGNYALIAREAATGKEVFSTRRALSTYNILSLPYVVGDVLYVSAASNNQGRELAVLVLNASDGKLQKTINIGSYAVDQNQVYNERVSQPGLLAWAGRLYVETQSGLLISLNPASGEVDWAVQYESPAPPAGYYYDYQGPVLTSGPLVPGGGLLFSKGMRSTRLLGLRTEGPALAWNRPVVKSAMLIGVDGQRVYMGGEELTAYDLATQELTWATQLPRTASWGTPLLTANRIYQFTSRGVCEVDKATGEILKIFRGIDLDSFGGSLFVTPDVLITVSNAGITAYPLHAQDAEKTAQQPLPTTN